MSKIIVYGTGNYYKQNEERIKKDYEIVAYADSKNYTSKTGDKIDDKVILSPKEISNIVYDYVLICTTFNPGNRIFQTLIKNGITSDKIKFLNRNWEYVPTEDGKGYISQLGQIRIREEHLTDFDIVHEIFVNRTYNISKLKEKTIVIDMGMNIGVASLYFAQRKEVEKVYGFEPFEDTYRQAVNNFELNEENIKNKIVPYNFALLDKDEKCEVDITAEETGWRNIRSCSVGKNHASIEIKDAGKIISDIMNENKDSNFVLKMDVEGSEYKILPRLLQEQLLDKVYAILMEYHGDSDTIEEMLVRQGFTVFALGESKAIGCLYAIK